MRNAPVPRRGVLSIAALAVTVSVGAAACGGGDDDDATPGPPLPADAEAGRSLARDKGCAACHGGDGQGGIGPAWVGLAGSTVTLDGGSTVVADDAYLTRAIAEPSAEMVAGYTIQMPANSLNDAEVAQIVTYIRSLGDGGSPATTSVDS